MNAHEVRTAIQQAEQSLRAADNCVNDLAYLLIGRLDKGVSDYTLKKLKKQLENYNMQTGRWK